MPLITRVKNILLSPGTEWEMIRSETDTPQSLLRSEERRVGKECLE